MNPKALSGKVRAVDFHVSQEDGDITKRHRDNGHGGGGRRQFAAAGSAAAATFSAPLDPATAPRGGRRRAEFVSALSI
jgi:hypothetical protein